MRKILGFLTRLVLASMLMGWPAQAISFDQNTIVTFSNCSSGGSSAQTMTGGDYILTVTGENTWLCIANSSSTCGSGGSSLLVGTMMVLTIGNKANTYSVSCRSTGSTGTLSFTKKGN